MQAFRFRVHRTLRLDNEPLSGSVMDCLDVETTRPGFDPFHLEIIGFKSFGDE